MKVADSTASVVHLAKYRAMREMLEYLHRPETKALVYDGAVWEFNHVIAPLLRDLLTSKGTPAATQNELIALLEAIYGAHHVKVATTQRP